MTGACSGPAFGGAVARSAGQLWPVHHLLQLLRSLAQGWRVGSAYECADRRHDTAVQMIDTFIVRVHQHGACIAGNSEQLMGRSRGGLTTKIHAVVDTSGLPVRLALTTGELRIVA